MEEDLDKLYPLNVTPFDDELDSVAQDAVHLAMLVLWSRRSMEQRALDILLQYAQWKEIENIPEHHKRMLRVLSDDSEKEDK